MAEMRKGAMAVWLVALSSIFIVMLVYLIFNQVFYSSYGLVQIVNASFNGSTANLTSPLSSMSLIQTVWNNWPAVAIFGIILWAVTKSVGGPQEVQYG